ncbi:MAG TPA: BamA/TamA family outer membrane protein, partial [Flavisolibacter sp.]|nr:BamA/TamA family outer membrane protein [Flavisolibacter sp.]
GQIDSLRSIPDTINQRIFLIGDAGEMNSATHPVVDWLKKNVDWNDERNSVIFLGDNIYPLGLPLEGDPTYPHAKAILDDQISLVKGKKAKAFFIPGNHDWRNGKLGGWEQVMNQVDYINSLQLKNVQAWPLNGCPGPIEVELSDKVVVVLVDSQWFLFLHDKPGPGSTCSSKTLEEFGVELAEIAASHPNQMLIIASHHPLYSYGPHGGDYTWREHIFPFTAINPNLYIPLPIIGSIYPIARGIFGNVQDIPHPLYKTMINTIEDVMRKHPYSISVAGHDHGLQFIMRNSGKDTLSYIVSGAGSVLTRIKPRRFSRFADVNIGFSVIEVYKSGKSDVKFYNLSSKDFNDPTYTHDLKAIAPPPPPVIDTTKIILDSIVYKPANPALEGTGFSRFLLGDNYRKEWTTPLRLHVLDMGNELGGLTPLKQGGGKQTKSLRVQDTSGKEWALRSVQKYPDAAIPADLRRTVVKDIIAEGVSASYPYGVLSMEPLSKAAGVPYLRDRLVYVPDDPRLQRFRADFKNMVALMEEREPPGVKKTDNTDELFVKLENDNDDHVDQKAVLKARLLDMFVMDFDRHEGQWLWATRDTGKGKIYYPIPKDRDQVFFTNQGLLPKIARMPSLVPEIQGFKARAENIKTFNRAARNFDRTFLTELDQNVWKHAVDSFLSTMTDRVIESALQRQPDEIQNFSAGKIINTLKERRKYFENEMMEYYRFLSKIVTVVGSNQREQFRITKDENGMVHVVTNKIAKDSSISSKIYDRVFDPKVTKEIRIYGLKDDDRFIVEGSNSPIKIRLIGGSGNDQFINNGSGRKVLAYDASFEKNNFSGSTDFKKIVKANPQVNSYSRLNFKYNLFLPGLAFEYNIDDGLFLGPRFQYTKQGFRREPYGMRQFFQGKIALKTGSLHFQYDADYMRAIGAADILIRSDFRAPVNVTNFFGLGNATKMDLNSHNTQYYRARYNIINASAYLSYQTQSWMRVNIGPSFQYFRLDSTQNKNRFVTSAGSGLDHNDVFSPRHYLGADARLAINSRNNNIIPTRGLVLDAGVRQLFAVDGRKNAITQVNVDMRIFMSLFAFQRLVLATRFGWGKNYGDFQFPQAMYLGGTDNLRGYRKQRFAGRSMLFNNTELRIRVANFNTYLFGGIFGVQIFNDIGRVYMEDAPSGEWHNGYGAGIWIAPIKRFVVTASLAHSKEEKLLPRLTFGFQF